MAVPFSFRNKEYYSLIHCVPAADCVAIKVTIMDGELERLLSGKNIFQFKDGRLLSEQSESSGIITELHREILQVLQPYVTSFVPAGGSPAHH